MTVEGARGTILHVESEAETASGGLDGEPEAEKREEHQSEVPKNILTRLRRAVGAARANLERQGGGGVEETRGYKRRTTLLVSIMAVAWIASFIWTVGWDGIANNEHPIEGDQVSQNWWLGEYSKRFWGVFRGGHLFGWTDDFGAGQPFGYFYFPLPATVYSLIEPVLGGAISAKAIQVAGIALVIGGAWTLARSMGSNKISGAFVAGAVAFGMYHPQRYPVGGDIPSTLIGEFSYAWGFGLGLAAVGVILRNLRETPQRWRSGAVLAAGAVAGHLNAALVIAAGSLIYTAVWIWKLGEAKKRLVNLAATSGAALGLLGFWLLPMWSMHSEPQTNNKIIEKSLLYWFPDPWWQTIAVIGGIGLGAGMFAKSKNAALWFSLGLGGIAIHEALAEWPDFLLWGGRAMPLVYTSAFVGVGELLGLISGFSIKGRKNMTTWLAASLLLGGSLVMQMQIVEIDRETDIPWRERTRSTWKGIGVGDEKTENLVDELVAALQNLPSGRLFVAPSRVGFDTFGASDLNGELLRRGALESGASTFFHEGNRGRIAVSYATSGTSTRPMIVAGVKSAGGGTRAFSLGLEKFDTGVEALRQIGVRYYVIYEQELLDLAEANSRLKQVAAIGSTKDGAGRFFRVYEIADHAIVEGLNSVVGISENGVLPMWGETTWNGRVRAWLARVGEVPYEGATLVQIGVEDDESEDWGKHSKAVVSDIEISDERIAFSVEETGSPVIIRNGYSPQWKVRGGNGPWYAAPHGMMVVPTEKRVEVYFEHPKSETYGAFLSLLCAGWLTVGGVRGRRGKRGERRIEKDIQPDGETTRVTPPGKDRREATLSDG